MANVERRIMAIKRKTYSCVPGETSMTAPELAYIPVLHMVALNGKVHRIITSDDDMVLTGLQVRHSPSFGALFFNELIPFEAGNSINVVYETV